MMLESCVESKVMLYGTILQAGSVLNERDVLLEMRLGQQTQFTFPLTQRSMELTETLTALINPTQANPRFLRRS